jgi:para-aminobenzoate synthetase/4-amino-4-deoxychorismate lyase
MENVNGPTAPLARFDDLTAGGRSVLFENPCGEVKAGAAEEVVAAIGRVEAAVARGLHAAGFIAYEAAPAFDPAMAVHPPDPALPLVWFGLFRGRRECEPLGGLGGGSEAPPVGPWNAPWSASEYRRRVRTIRHRIEAGETYQVNLTFPLTASYPGDEAPLYAAVCRAQRAAYGALLRGSFGSVISASPELFFRWRGESLEMRPMKGTRPRGRWSAEDHELARELAASSKERAENLMIVDLLRNDVGRVAEFGSVVVPDLFRVEKYPTVQQLTSTVAARTRPGTSLTDVLRALFPSGSVTGAPKIQTMRIIRELEQGPRGVYTGAVGFVSPGEAVFNVPIRTLVRTGGGTIALGVGSGITYDSNEDAELAECMQKARFVHARMPDVELLETMRHDPGSGFHRLEAHLARVRRSADYFGCPVDLPRVRRELDRAVSAFRSGRRIRADSPTNGGDPGSGEALKVRLIVRITGDIFVECAPIGSRATVLRVRVAAEPVDSRNPFLFHKTTARDMYKKRLADSPGYDDVLLVNEREELTEFTRGNLIVESDGHCFTPPVESGLLPGIEREARIAAGELEERVLTVADLATADAVYFINSVRGRIPVAVVS